MASLLRQYLCCCLPQPRPTRDTERQPLLDPDVLPQAPPRPPPTRTTEEHEQEQQLRRNILNQASERLINILSPHPFTSLQTPSTPPSLNQSPSTSPTNDLSSLSSSPTLTSRHSRRSRSWRPSPHDPIAPVRVVHLGKNWEVLNHESQGGVEGDPSVTPSTMRRQRKSKGKEKGRPPSSHSMRTLPRGGGGGSSRNQPSPLRRGGSNGESSARDLTVEGPGDEEEFEEDGFVDEGDTESRFGTIKSYRTAASNAGDEQTEGGGSSFRGSRFGLRDIWGTAMGGEGEDEEEYEDPQRKEQLKKALEVLERDIDDWSLKPVGPIVADLGDYKPNK